MDNTKLSRVAAAINHAITSGPEAVTITAISHENKKIVISASRRDITASWAISVNIQDGINFSDSFNASASGGRLNFFIDGKKMYLNNPKSVKIWTSYFEDSDYQIAYFSD